MLYFRKWKEEHDRNPLIISYEDWVRLHATNIVEDIQNPEDQDKFLLCRKPSQKALRYRRMKSFGNHFQVEDDISATHNTYNSGVASVFNMCTEDATNVQVSYVGVLKDIIALDYGPLSTPIILLRCEWMKRHDRRGNPSYIRDEAGFLVVNFCNKLPSMSEPFIFSSQATQVFFSDAKERPGWKVVLQKEARARREVVDTTNAFITTTAESSGLVAPVQIPAPPEIPTLIGAIELSTDDHLLACRPF